MFNNVKSLKLVVLLLLLYSVGATVYVIQNNSSSSLAYSKQMTPLNVQITQLNIQIAQLNAQIAQQNIQINAIQKDTEDLKTIRALVEKERAEKEAGQKLHEKSLTGVRDQFEGLDQYETAPNW